VRQHFPLPAGSLFQFLYKPTSSGTLADIDRRR
jgi:hypothetical protein